MKLYINSVDNSFSAKMVPDYVISIDPGQSTMGIFCCKMATKDVYMRSICSKASPMGCAMGKVTTDTYRRVAVAWEELKSWICNAESITLIIEQTTTNFQFSSGIISCVQCWTDLILKDFPKAKVLYVSNKITNFLTRKVKITATDSRKIVLSERPEWKKLLDNVGKRSGIYSHLCDAILMNWVVYYDEWGFKNLRRPKNEIVII